MHMFSMNRFFSLEIRLDKKTQKALIRVLAGICINLSAGWFAFVLITPNFLNLALFNTLILLFLDLLFGIMFLTLAVILERANR